MKLSTIHTQFSPPSAVYLAIVTAFLISHMESPVGSQCPGNRGFGPYTYIVQHHLLPSENKLLVNHQIHLVNNLSSVWRCGTMCLVRGHCVSFNYDRTSGVCELNDADADVYPCHLVDSERFGYYHIQISEHEQVIIYKVAVLIAKECL